MVSQKHEQKVKEVKKAKGLAGEHRVRRLKDIWNQMTRPDGLWTGSGGSRPQDILPLHAEGVSAIATTLERQGRLPRQPTKRQRESALQKCRKTRIAGKHLP